MEDIPKLWLISAVLSLQELRNTQKRGGGDGNTELFIVHGLDKRNVPKKKKIKRNVPQWTASASAIHIYGRSAKHPPPPKK